jgi:hypothetical protein
MDLLISTISKYKDIWLKNQIENQSSIYGFILNYIYTANKLRKPQIESIETYLYLRCILGNTSILEAIKLNKIPFQDKKLTSNLLNFCENLLLEFQTKKLLSSDQLMNFRNALFNNPEKFIDQLFDGLGDLNYQIYSLPMGAGKTYLMASLIYLELYLSKQQNDGAKNFLITIPNAKKTSILNSLKSIRKFDPTWILPENEAKKLYQIITERFIILDQPKANKNSNTTENPNVAKIQSFLALGQNLEGLVVIVNAEKVILDQIDKINSQVIFNEEEKEKAARANELRQKLSQIPNLMVLMDEVQYNQNKENLLNKRFIHGSLKQSGNLVRVLGFTGTPYFSQTLQIENFKLKINQIPSTVYHYSLANGISKFLKKPIIKEKIGLNSKELVRSGLAEFFEKYNFNYSDCRSTKLAIYCTSIESLKSEILPVVQEFYQSKNRDFDEVFYFHTNNKDYKCPKEYANEFENFDTLESTKRVILLVGIGAVGWDCQSLTAVIFSNDTQSSQIKVLQSVCRCLREVEDASKESGLIVLNTHNKQYLEEELQKQHNVKLQDFTDPKGEKVPTRINRVNELGLPKIQIHQFQTRFIESKNEEIKPNTKQELKQILENLEVNFIQENTIQITENGLEINQNTEIKSGNIGIPAHFDYWLLDIVKYSLGEIKIEDLEKFETDLKPIFTKVTILKNQTYFYNQKYNQIEVKTSIIKAFVSYNQELQTELYTENIDIDWLVTGFDEKPLIHFENSKFDPKNWQTAFEIKIDENIDLQILELEKTIENSPLLKDFALDKIEELKQNKQSKNKFDRSYHYAPYDFKDSNDEFEVYQALIKNQELQDAGLECYYSGDRFLSNFKINTYKKTGNNWKLIRPYTPDFIALKRDSQNQIEKLVIIETKGRQDDTDKAISEFMKTEFVKANPHIKYHYSLSEIYQDKNHRINTIKNFILENLL